VAWHTFGCKANQYDSERMRQEVEARGARYAPDPGSADILVVNTCTVTNQADADARRLIGRVRRSHPHLRVVVAGCSAALRSAEYRGMDGVSGVVEGHDPVAVADAVGDADALAGAVDVVPALVQLTVGRSRPARDTSIIRGDEPGLDRIALEPVGRDFLHAHRGQDRGWLNGSGWPRSRGWLKIQDGCDRRCSFCATRLARGRSRSRSPAELVAEARGLAARHPEIVITGIHIGHYGLDLYLPTRLSDLMARLLDEVPGVRFRLGSIEATEVDNRLAQSDGRLVPHLHMPLQSGANPVLRRMRRWHTREMYRDRALEIAARLGAGSGAQARAQAGSPAGSQATAEAAFEPRGVFGLGADIITGFPGETDDDHQDTMRLVEELPFTYLHVFPFSPREGTEAAELAREMPVPQRVAGERARELRELGQGKGEAYRRARAGSRSRVVLEGKGRSALTEDYLRVEVIGTVPDDRRVTHGAELRMVDGELVAEVGTEADAEAG